MTSEACDDRCALEVRAIQLHRHAHLFAPDQLRGLVILFPKPDVFAGLRILIAPDVAVITVDTKRISDEVHDQEQLRIWQSPQHLNVFSDLFDWLVGGRGLAMCSLALPH